jgi:pimeloyl-ACP methyl ester carboxylesterase
LLGGAATVASRPLSCSITVPPGSFSGGVGISDGATVAANAAELAAFGGGSPSFGAIDRAVYDSRVESSKPRVLLIHGSAADRTTWSIQLAGPLREKFELIAYDRGELTSVAAYAAEAAKLLDSRALVIGSSFGAVVTLELVRTRPELCAGAILIEPPMAPTDDPPTDPVAFLAEFDQRVIDQGGPAAGEFFLRTVLGDTAFERMPKAFRERSAAKWAAIRADSQALIEYRPRYAELASDATPVLLLGGDRSASYFRPTLDALAKALPRARLEIVSGAGHMLHAEASRRFAELLIAFAAEINFG